MHSISELESQIRDLINTPRLQHALIQSRNLWNQLCSALDVLGDTEMAIAAYLSHENDQKVSQGKLYLNIYGLLQVLVVQQDAVQHIAEALTVEYKMAQQLLDIREIRNHSVGHPSRRGKAPRWAFNFVSRVSMSENGFDLHTVYSEGQPAMNYIDLPKLISTQRETISISLTKFLHSLNERESQHRKKFRDNKLASAFAPHLGYAYEKIGEEIHGSRSLGLGETHVHTLNAAINAFESMLLERGELPAIQDVFDYDAQPARHALMRLSQFFNRADSSPIESADAIAFLESARAHIHGLQDIANEIDQNYESGHD